MRRVWIAGQPVNAVEAVMLVGALLGHALAPDSFWPLLGGAGMVILPIGLGYRGRTSSLNEGRIGRSRQPELRAILVVGDGGDKNRRPST